MALSNLMPWRGVTDATPAARPRPEVAGSRGPPAEEAASFYAELRKTWPPEGSAVNLPAMEPIGPQLWMTPNGIFHLPGRGTVLTGRLEGRGPLSVGDDLVCEGAHWPVTAIEMPGTRALKTAEPGADIGVLLRSCATPDVLRGKTVQFVSKSGRGNGPRFNRRRA